METSTSNTILERIHSVLGNLVHTYNIKDTYLDKDTLWMGILAAAKFEIISNPNSFKNYTLVQSVFACDMIMLIKKNHNGNS